ncbi:MAG TPA: thioesterase family protein [Bryobacteraceae bacterium]|nr:thioesterase family protein [Bryobacteraceae bacterium]
MKPPPIPLNKIAALEPVCLRATVPDSYRDSNGHMNVRWYIALFDDAGDTLHDWMGLTQAYHAAHGTGTFDLEYHVNFISEVLPGEDIVVYIRLVAYTAKRLHYVMFLVNATRGKLAATLECINSFADLRDRRTASWPPEVAAKLAEAVEADRRLDWAPPLSGAMHA